MKIKNNKTLYFISDLHLHQEAMQTVEIFKNFMQGIAKQDNALFILGDFFNFWIGDDDLSDFNLLIIEILRSATQDGLEIYFMHGNRDFLIKKDFAKLTEVKILKDPSYILFSGKKIALTHGDLLCTDDKKYLRLRKYIRNSFIQWLLMLGKSLEYRRNFAQKTRRKSQVVTKRINPNVDVTQKGINKYLKNSQIIIHGHTHKLAKHNEPNCTRYVLGDWYKDGNYIKVNNKNIVQISSILKNK